MQFQTTGKSKVHSVKSCVLFDPSSGVIRHLHRVVTMEGADETPSHVIEQRAIHLAKELGVATESLEFLHVDANSIKPNTHYKVDPIKRHLIEVKQPGTEAEDFKLRFRPHSKPA